ncbi:TonB-dependent receptor [Steroidobacter sp. S1-65]|uniref:TonB-dependent receptor n=2 Tax=Steroidobacter gossypii TaxID=2805490 RepID=A0ABS1WVF1_9GAMM|nr:TonB-dependent receptor [Steroidobacter gossypii]
MRPNKGQSLVPEDVSEEIVVTGSHIRGAAAEGPSPMIIFRKQDIEATGVATMQQFFEKLPQNFGGGANGANVANLGVDRDTGNNFGQGSTINLRGLGTGTTLTLVNGHRVSSSNRYQYVDVSLIPMSAVERVEILTDGASAIYGADAVGGVVNIVLRKEFTGYETGLRYGTVTAGDLEEYQATQAAGWSWDGGHALASYEFLSQDNLSAADRDFARNVTSRPFDLYPGSKRHSVYLDGAQRINEALAVNLSGFFAERDMDTTISSPTDATHLVPETRQYDLFAGLTLDLPRQWQARLTAGYGQSDVRYERTETTATSVTTAPPTDMNSDIRYLDLIADGEVLSLPAGGLRAAVGASYRREGYDFFDHRSLEQPFDSTRDITSAFGELNIPLLKGLRGARNLSLTAAARYDDYSDFGSTTNPKIGVLWEAASGLLFRASYGRSFRAPAFEDMQANRTSVVVFNLPDPGSPTGRTLTMQAAGGNPELGPERAKTWSTGFTIKPDWAPNLVVQANYYDIDYSDRIDRGFAGNITTLLLQSTAPYAPILTFNPGSAQIEEFRQLGLAGASFLVVRAGPFAVPADMSEQDVQLILDNRVRNIAETSQRGLDLDASYAVEVGQSRIGFSIAGQYVIDATRRVTSVAPEADALNLVYLPVDLKVRGGATFTRHDVRGAVFVNYVDSYRDPSSLLDPKVDSWLTVDMNVTYDFASPLGRKTSLGLSVNNLLDRDPPFVVNLRGTGFDPINATPIGRFIALAVTHQW